MAQTLEERVAYLEGKVEEHSRGYAELREMIIHLDQKIDRFREELSASIDGLEQKMDRFREELSGRIDALDEKISRYFLWTIGIQITVLLAVIGALLAS